MSVDHFDLMLAYVAIHLPQKMNEIRSDSEKTTSISVLM